MHPDAPHLWRFDIDREWRDPRRLDGYGGTVDAVTLDEHIAAEVRQAVAEDCDRVVIILEPR